MDCGSNWSKEQIEQAVQDGPNHFAQDPLAPQCCCTKALKKVDEGFLSNWELGRPQKKYVSNIEDQSNSSNPTQSQDYCMILNLKYGLLIKGQKGRFLSANETTAKELALQNSMYELGNVVPRIIWRLATAPDEDIPFLMSKVDLKERTPTILHTSSQKLVTQNQHKPLFQTHSKRDG